MVFVANVVLFPAAKKTENRLRFEKCKADYTLTRPVCSMLTTLFRKLLVFTRPAG